MKTRWLYLFWGGMDLFYIGRFCYLNFSQGKVPLYSDIQSFILLSAEHGYISGLLFLLSFFLNISIVFSMYLFFRASRLVPCLAYVQAPLRLLLAVPSLSFLLWLSKVGGVTSAALLFGLLMLSEVIKFFSIFFRIKLRLV
jgi:hypothetical protein